MKTPSQARTPIIENAMPEAAKQLYADLCDHVFRKFGCLPINADQESIAIIQKHFQPLLAKVEAENAKDISELIDSLEVACFRHGSAEYYENHLADKVKLAREAIHTRFSSLRADLAAKEAAQTEMKEYLRNMAHKLNAVLGLNERECAYLNRLQEQDDAASALASRADKGGAT